MSATGKNYTSALSYYDKIIGSNTLITQKKIKEAL